MTKLQIIKEIKEVINDHGAFEFEFDYPEGFFDTLDIKSLSYLKYIENPIYKRLNKENLVKTNAKNYEKLTLEQLKEAVKHARNYKAQCLNEKELIF